MATTVDFKLDDQDTMQDLVLTNTPNMIKRKLNEIRSPEMQSLENTSPLVTLRKQKESQLNLISPEHKKRNILVDCDLDPETTDPEPGLQIPESQGSIEMDTSTNTQKLDQSGSQSDEEPTTNCEVGLRKRHHSDPGDIGTSEESAMMSILLDIRARIHNLESKEKR